MYVVVGLGNPGRKYLNTRHNVGFDMIDVIASKFKTKITRVKHKALTGECEIAGEKVLLVKPQTYMNLSGECVREIAEYYKIDSAHMIVIYDEAALVLGRLRIRTNGSSGGHNGIKNIVYRLQTEDFIRIRVGIGTGSERPLLDFVLDNFSKQEIDTLIQTAVLMPDIIETIIKSGSAVAMNIYNPHQEKD